MKEGAALSSYKGGLALAVVPLPYHRELPTAQTQSRYHDQVLLPHLLSTNAKHSSNFPFTKLPTTMWDICLQATEATFQNKGSSKFSYYSILFRTKYVMLNSTA